METVFDHGITEAEYDQLFGGPIPTDPKFMPEFDADTENGMIFRLYSIRGRDELADKYYHKIKDHSYRLNLNINDTD